MEDDFLIRIPENEFEALLDREKVISDVDNQLSQWTHLMRDVVNYGTNLIPRCFVSSSRSLADAVLIGILLRQAVAMLDGAEVLLSNGAVHAAKSQMRGLFEVRLYIEWILSKDFEKKADYYYVHNLRRKRRWAERVEGSSPVGQEFVAMMNGFGVPTRKEASEAAKQQLPEIDRILSQPKFAHITAEFDKSRKGKSDGNWYAPLGPRNLREIAKEVGKLPEYILACSGGSEAMHGSNYEHHLTSTTGRITFTPIRYLQEFGWVYHFSVSFAFSIYRSFLEEYRPGEVAAFSRKYLEKWRKDYMNMPNVKIEETSTTI